MYVICITEILARRVIAAAQLEQITAKPGDLSIWRLAWSLQPDQVTYKRKEIQALIQLITEIK